MAADLKERFGADSKLIKGSEGVFEVRADESLVFSKKDLGRFPEPGEVESAIAGMKS
ncbi:MAG: Rdx family protein [Acidobacteria bacterium]|nr:Rdx family protein [Acidobacteriota bacterium]